MNYVYEHNSLGYPGQPNVAQSMENKAFRSIVP